MSGGNTKTTTETGPTEQQKPFYQQLYESAQKAFGQTQGQGGYTGNFIAGPNQLQTQANTQLANVSSQLGQGGQQLRQLGLDTIAGNYLKPESNPFLSGAIQAALNPVTKSYMETVLPSINDAAISSGAYGGSRQDLSQQAALADYAKQAQDTTSQIAYSNYAQERQNQLGAGQLLNQADALALAPSSALAAAGKTQQGWEQGGLENAYQKWLAASESPWLGLDKYSALLNGAGFNSSTETKPNSVIGQILQGLTGVAGLASLFK